jgi:hypothetical protein
MAQVVQARCPHCKQVLRIPSQWLFQPMRCKHCRQTFQARPKSATPPPPAKSLHVKPAAALPAPPQAIPLPAKPVNPFDFDRPALPVAIPLAAAPPLASRGIPAAIPLRPAAPRPVASTWWKGALIAAAVVGITAIVTTFFGRDILDLVVSADDREPPKKPRADLVVIADKAPGRNQNPELRPVSSNDKKNPRPGDKGSKKPKPVKPPRPDKPAADKPADHKPDPNKDNTVKHPPPRDMVGRDDRAKPPKDGTRPPRDMVKPPRRDEAKPVKDGPSVSLKDKDKPPSKDSVKPPPQDGNKPPPKDSAKPPVKDATPPKDGAKPPLKDGPTKPPKKAIEEFPRRALLVSVNNYLYANPLQYGRRDGNSGNPGQLASNLERFLHFPKSQITELSDGATGLTARAPLKPVVEQAIADFLAGSRPMDRVLLLFAGHVVEIDKAIYIVPLEGDLENAKSLIPLAQVLDQLVKCPARQKVLVLDVCRTDPARGQERQSTGAMGKQLDALLKNPPPGVQMWSSCVAGEQALEFSGGSLFIEAWCQVLQHKGIKGIQDPTDPLPMELLQIKVKEYIDMTLNGQKLKQTPRLAGKDPGKGAAYDPEADLAPALVIRPAPLVKDIVAPRELIAGILEEIESLPPPKGGPGPALRPEVMPAFPAKVMEKYRTDYQSLAELDQKLQKDPKSHALIRAVREASRVLKDNATVFRDVFQGRTLPVPPPIKAQVMKYQQQVAKEIFNLQSALEALKKAGEQRDEEKSPRWQANYDYVQAKLTARLIWCREFSLMMGKIRKDELPALKPKDIGWRLKSAAKLQSTDKDIKELVSEMKDAFKSLKKNHPNTPWEILARRDAGNWLGLDWEGDPGK